MFYTQKLLASILLAITVSSARGQSTPQVKQSTDPWWKHAVLYEIYPRSFQDSNGDGVGDLNGITQRLDYLQALGIDGIWLTPINPSPQVDFGYDVTDYNAIDPAYGTLADFDRLVAEAKKRNIRILLDMVMNHTSDQHPWFIESRSSRNNPKRDWYVWRDGKPGGIPPNNPPTNWISSFGHNAWQWDPKTKQYYWHHFYVEQPDLNWENPAVEKAVFDSFRFWMARGVGGFRLDAVTALFEDPQLRDAKLLPGHNAYGDQLQDTSYYSNLPKEHEVMRRLRKLTDTYPGDVVLVGETRLPAEELTRWYGGAKHDELQLPMDLAFGFIDRMDLQEFRLLLIEAETNLQGNQPLFVFNNHDRPRSLDRYGDGVHNPQIARLFAALLLTTKSTAMMYYGEELGMVMTPPKRKEDVKDPIGRSGWPIQKGRDGERTPMQWDASKNAGFSTAETTWLPVPPSYQTVNVDAELKNAGSLLNWYKQLIAMRRTVPSLHSGDITILNTDHPAVLAYARHIAGSPSTLVAMNFTAQPQTITLDTAKHGVNGSQVKTLMASADELKSNTSLTFTLPPFATWIGALSQ